MSLINDALKKAQQTPPRDPPATRPSLPTIPEEGTPVTAWFITVLVLVLIIAAVFFIGWGMAHKDVRSIVATPQTIMVTQTVVEVSSPPAATPPPPATPESQPPIIPQDAPKLQGIFYRPGASSAILDGKTVRVGDQFRQYRVKAISKNTVTLAGPDKKEFKISLGN